jgi:hypothetical protein
MTNKIACLLSFLALLVGAAAAVHPASAHGSASTQEASTVFGLTTLELYMPFPHCYCTSPWNCPCWPDQPRGCHVI